MSPKPAGAFRRGRWSLGFAVLAWSFQAQAAEGEVALDLGGVSLELRPIPKGTFTQGSPATEPGHEPEESARSVTISRPFWLGKVPVTRAQFSRFVAETRFVTDAEKGQSGGFGWDGKALVQKKEFTWRNPGFAQKDEDPVVLVTFGDATAFTAWASRKTGRRVRLPTEAEWEYAARAGTATAWYAASKEDEAIGLGWFRANASYTTHPVGLKQPNPFGLFDMTGNVYQWCRDVYAGYAPGDATDPENTTHTTADPERRVLRGGSWLRDVKRGRSAARNRLLPGTRNADNGFRVAMDDDPANAALAGSFPTNDVAPASSVGAGANPTPAASNPGAVTSQAAPPAVTPARASSEGSAWSLFVAPVASAAAVVAWVLTRRRRGDATTVDEPVSLEPPPNVDAPVKRDLASIDPLVSVDGLVSVDLMSVKMPISVGIEAPPLLEPISVSDAVEEPAPPHREPPPSSNTGPVAPAEPPADELDSVAIPSAPESLPAFESMPLSLPADHPVAPIRTSVPAPSAEASEKTSDEPVAKVADESE